MNQTTVAEFFKTTLLMLMPHQCYDTYFLKYDFLDVPCMKSVLSKGLGLAIVGGSVLVKVPQIMKIINNRSAKGISIIGVFLDLFAVTAVVSYSFVKRFPFSAWGDSLFLLIQTVIIVILVLYYAASVSFTVAFMVAFLPTLYALLSGAVPMQAIWTLQALSIPSMFSSKMVQAYTNYKAGSTGQLSAATCFMLFFGSVIRVFTSVQETGDFTIILMYCLAAFANSILVLQFYIYRKKSSKGSGKSNKGQKKQKAKQDANVKKQK